MTLTFSDLCTAMDAAGVEVRVVLTEDERHVVQLVDFSGLRSPTYRWTGASTRLR